MASYALHAEARLTISKSHVLNDSGFDAPTIIASMRYRLMRVLCLIINYSETSHVLDQSKGNWMLASIQGSSQHASSWSISLLYLW